MRLIRPLLSVLALLVLGSVPAAAQPASSVPDVVLRPGDMLKVAIWREEELSGEFQVDEQGAVTLPLLGRRQVAGRSMREVRGEMMAEYEQNLRNTAIEITPLRRVNILGEVARPGMYPLDPTVTLAGAVALAGGATPIGDLNRIRIVRDGQVYATRVSYLRTLENVDVRSGDQIMVGRRSWFDRNSTFLVSALLSITSIVVALVR